MSELRSFIRQVSRGFSGRQRPEKTTEGLLDRLNDMISDGFDLNSGLSGEIIEVSLAASETKRVSHGLGKVPKYRIILRQTGNGLVTDHNPFWTDKTVGFVNNSANPITLTIKIMLE